MKFQTSKHIYAHIDCDSFFASCEILHNPKLRGKYVCVGWDIIVAATYNAKKLWVKVGTPIWEAQRILRNKDAFFSWVHMSLYVDISRKLMKYLNENTLDVRIFSIDEAFVEITWLPEMYKLDIETYLLRLQQDILDTVWIAVSIGVSNTRLKAKIFSKVNKPFWICVWIDSDIERGIFTSLWFREIPFIGLQTSKKLEQHILNIQDYVDIGYFDIVRRFWKNWGKIWFELKGVSSMSFATKGVAKSMGRVRAFNREMTSDTHILLKKIQANVDRFCDELSYKWYEILNIELILIDKDWNQYKIRTEFSVYTSDRKVIFSGLTTLFEHIYTMNVLYRKTWVFSSQIQSIQNKQLSLFTKENINHSKNLYIENLLHEMEEKYGKGILRIGV